MNSYCDVSLFLDLFYLSYLLKQRFSEAEDLTLHAFFDTFVILMGLPKKDVDLISFHVTVVLNPT